MTSKHLSGPVKVKTADDLFWHWIRCGWKYRWRENSRMRSRKIEYADRVKYEATQIVRKDFVDYFLMLSEAVRWAKDNGIGVGPGRGSAASSLICYLLRITEVDPLAFPTMLFERFLDPGRLDLPDVDLDFNDDRRDEVRMHMVEKYGADHVGNIGNFIRYRGKNSINDVARVYRVPQFKAKRINDLIIERSGGDSRAGDSLVDTFEMFPQAQAILDEYPDLGYAMRLEGNYRGMSVHAAGLVISNEPLTDTCAIYTREVQGHTLQVIAYDKKDADVLGMLKADFLGLSTMGMIDIALSTIGMPLADLYRLPLDDELTIDGFNDNDVTGIFQFEGRATRLVNHDVKPDNFMELADITSLSRPGPLFSGMTAQYVEIKHKRAEPEPLHEIVDKVTAWTHGQIVYQEQVLTIIRELGGFPVKAVGDIRRIISQKLGEAQFNTMKDDFKDGAKKLHGVDPDLAEKIWKFMVTSATYSFNTSHAVAYAQISYYCMWLKQHYPLAFYAAQLRKIDKEKWPKLLRDAEKHGVTVEPPDPRTSGLFWEPVGEVREFEGGVIRAGLTQIPGIAVKRAQDVIEARERAAERGEPWTSWDDAIEVRGIGPKTIDKIGYFCEKDDPFDLYWVNRMLDKFRKVLEESGAGIVPTHKADEIPQKGEFMVTWIGLCKHKQYKDLLEDERARSGDTIEEIKARTYNPDYVKSCVLHCYDDTEEEVYLRIPRMKFPRFKRQLEQIEVDKHILVARGLKREGFGTSLQLRSLNICEMPD